MKKNLSVSCENTNISYSALLCDFIRNIFYPLPIKPTFYETLLFKVSTD